MMVKNPSKNINNRILVATPTTGLVRMEWVLARYGQIIPTNWSQTDVAQFYNPFVPIGYQVADAENIVAKHVVEGNFEWLLFLEHDNVIPQNTFRMLNEYMIEKKVPIVAGLYFTKSDPPEPMVYRKWGNGYYDKWKLGDKVWCKGVPFGCTLIHGSIIRELWNQAEEYMIGNVLSRKVFHHGEQKIKDEYGIFLTKGTTDLVFCKEIVDKKIFLRAGWKKYQDMEFPILVDTRIFVKHIDQDGNQWPLVLPKKYAPKGTKFY